MAMLPVLLDLVDEIYNGLDNQKDGPSHYPLLFLQQRPQSVPGCGKGMRLGGCPTACGRKNKRCGMACSRRGNCGTLATCDDFAVTLDVKNFKPEEIEVKVKDREIIIEGKHEERQDNHGFVSRQFTRRYLLPEEFDPDTISTYLTTEGKMTVKAEKPKPKIDQTPARVIPIQHIAEAPAVEPQLEAKKTDEGEKTKESEKPLEE